MRRTLMIAALLLLTAGAVVAQHDEVPWLEGQTWETIVAKASAENRHILIDFYAVWCGPCKMLDEQVYNQPEVIEALAPLICFKVDVDKKEYVELKTAFGVQAMPTMVVCKPNGEEVDRFLGFRPADVFVASVNDYVAGRNTYTDLSARLAASPDDPELLFKMGGKHSERNEGAEAKKCFDRVLELDPKNEAGFTDDTLMSMAEMAAMGRDVAGAADLLERVITEYPNDVDVSELRPFLAWAQGAAGRKDDQVKTLRAHIVDVPDDVRSLNALAWTLAELELDLEEATTHALKAAELSDNDPGVVDTVAEVYLKRGMKDEALKWMDVALAKDSENAELKAKRARIAGEDVD